MPAEDDRNFLTDEFEKLLTEKSRLCRDHADVEAPGAFVLLAELIRLREQGVERTHSQAEPPQIHAFSPGRE
ncbi:hypothetical protein [Bradyrhizobium sp. 170]|uniref:hypothetical protein n=1 Tax=Bradyrhizobium sp. 170 TaxID=2782641 RepID=UPI001FFF153E|nr:hypothetical protein [Bradyrhizobium sp. 170]UPK05535.1 hypothetical protein IVB05_07635 [Bradyrhizobium sp. 170]